ncbi:fructooligosaccharide transport system substrate-binding protein [Gracilibacillus ureilyticus]|uniref:Fructooligosaccharide transport system substrate-binding protein n=1 Tax=Gracilibacillus ureilyticus TaxID=531814 RepID=A0A1H9V635_9BACI|nr:ABC transporter substrate-binding protein [Gracilibacillus ureilyticus]SES17038.1 fructooligosaccharide transport system substrate-binding protein [Gracilibacillus ureilyticus]
MKKVMFLTGLLFMAIIVTACGGGNSSSGAGDNEVSLWVHTSDETPEGEAMQNIIDRFNEENEGTYSAKIEFIPRSGAGGGYEDKINAALTTDSLPDVLTLDGPNTAAYAEAGIIAPIDDYITNKDDLLPSIIQQGTYEDQLYAVGYSESGVGVFYNKQMLEEAGIDLSTLPTVEEPWDWNQFMELSETLVNTYDTAAIDMGLDDKSEWLMYAFSPFLWSQGGNIVSEDGTTAEGYFNDENSVKAFSFIQEMVKEGYTTITPVEKGFHTGEYAMKFGGSWTIAELEDYPDVEYGVMPYPTSPDTNELVSPSGSWQYAMAASTEKQEAAGALIDFMTSTESLTEITLANSVLPAAHSVVEEVQDKVSPEMNVLIQQNQKSAHARPVLPNYPQVSRVFQQTVSDVAYYEENSDVQKLLDEKTGQMEKALK